MTVSVRKKTHQASDIPNDSTQNYVREPQASQVLNERIILWKQLWSSTYL